MLVVLSGCPTPRTGAPSGTTIAVQEFVVPSDVVVRRYSGSLQTIGMRYAQTLAERLTGLGYQAAAVPQGAPTTGQLIVSGSIDEINGGNTAKRLLLGFGAGRSELDVYGTVKRADGSVVGEFTESRASTKGWSEEGAMDNVMERTAKQISRMIYTGEYRRNAPPERPAAKAFTESHNPTAATSQTTVEQRLQALESLRANGTITPAEYEARRRAILDSL
jgi:hypothetical protein